MQQQLVQDTHALDARVQDLTQQLAAMSDSRGSLATQLAETSCALAAALGAKDQLELELAQLRDAQKAMELVNGSKTEVR